LIDSANEESKIIRLALQEALQSHHFPFPNVQGPTLMGTTYTATIQVQCWKEHCCIGCGCTYAYLFERKVTGSSANRDSATANARAAAVKSVERDVDQQPCPTCGLYQPDMVGVRRSKRHWWLVWIHAGFLGLLLLLYGMEVFPPSTLIQFAVAVSIVAIAGHFLIARDNPNRNLERNRQLALRRNDLGVLQIGQAGKTEPLDPELSAGRWPLAQQLAFAAMVMLLAFLIFPEVIRTGMGWTENKTCSPPVAGPGDAPCVYLPRSIKSIKGYWRAQGTLEVRDLSNPNVFIPAQASSQADNWGASIHAKSSEKDKFSRLWVRVHLPPNSDLSGKTIEVKIDLDVQYPQVAGNIFNTVTEKVSHTTTLQLSSVRAGAQYRQFWWLGMGIGAGGIWLLSLLIIWNANRLRKQAPPTKAYTA
jgi:hypothetical protein